MRKNIITALLALLALTVQAQRTDVQLDADGIMRVGAPINITQSDASADSIGKIHYHCATKAEGQELMGANTDYYNSLTQMDLDWRMRKTGTTREELIDFAKSCVQEFTEEDKASIAKTIAAIEQKLHKMGANLPFPKDDIVFVKTNMQEEGGAGGYTHKTEIYLDTAFLEWANSDSTSLLNRLGFLVAHELFHCLTRNSPDFRRGMYNLIGFTVMEKDHVFAPAIQQKILTNPDVEHIDNYAEFTINGVKRKCELIVLYTHSWEEAVAKVGESKATFFDFNQSVLVPIDKPDTYYPISEASDFWDIVGQNTPYVLAPEECLADNFAMAVLSGSEAKFKSQKLIDDIISFLKSYQQKD